ncbi:MAG: class I SAM-dependent methyltransferase [Gammaproteobacteria bacterium]|nr:class I SAM-dependent methyltransferase [Gammaproteobacteria bacterium]MBU1446756.1 class I SAM-dependent methyltransferase [Gammaproteobacteria bacterium]
MLNHLDLGCGTTPHNPYGKPNVFGIDVRDDVQALLAGKGIVMRKANLILERIPFEDNFFSSVSAIDFLEHIPRQICLGATNEITYPFIELMNEIWRVLAPGGLLLAVTPAFPSPLAFADPTHVNHIAEGTHEYFCGEKPAGGIYGFNGRFRARIAKRSVPTNFRKMPPNPWEMAIRDLGRRLSGKGLHHMVWELEAVK